MLEDLNIDNIQVSSMVYSGEKSYKYFIAYIDDDDYIIKPLTHKVSKNEHICKNLWWWNY